MAARPTRHHRCHLILAWTGVDIHRQVWVVTVPLTGTKLVAVCHQACGHPVSAPGSSLYMSAVVALLASCSSGWDYYSRIESRCVF